MPKTYKISVEEAAEIREKMKETKNTRVYKRLEVAALRGEGKNNEEIATITKYNEKWVSQIVSDYCNKGLKYLSKENRGGTKRQSLSYEKESSMLEEFARQAENGQIITVKQIKKRYEELIGRTTKSRSQIYTVLERHGWRKVMPRSRHPKKANDEEIEASKKLTQSTKN
jgi:transposase